MEYTQEFKEAIIQKIFLNSDRTVVSFAREASMPESTVATWIRNHKKKNGKKLNSKRNKRQWSAENKFEAVFRDLYSPLGIIVFRSGTRSRADCWVF